MTTDNNLFQKIVMSDQVEVIDDFFQDTSFFFQTLSHKQTKKIPGVNYSGEVIWFFDQDLEKVSALVMAKFPDIDEKLLHARLRVTTKDHNNTQTSYIHSDPDEIRIVVYLQLPPDTEKQGTYFYVHPRNNSRKIPLNLSVKEHFIQQALTADKYFSEWTCWKEVEPKTNRAVIFDGHLFHSGPLNFSGSAEFPRVTLECAVSRKDSSGRIAPTAP